MLKIIKNNPSTLNTEGVLNIIRDNPPNPNINLIVSTVKRHVSPEIIRAAVKDYTIKKEDARLLIKSIISQYIDGIGLWVHCGHGSCIVTKGNTKSISYVRNIKKIY